MNRAANVRMHHPPTIRFEDLLVIFISMVKSYGVDKDELVAVFRMSQDAIRSDLVGGGD